MHEKPICKSGAHFTNDFPSKFKMQWKICWSVKSLQQIISLQNFAHAMAAHLSCQVLTFKMITSLQLGWQQNKISINFELQLNECLWKVLKSSALSIFLTCTKLPPIWDDIFKFNFFNEHFYLKLNWIEIWSSGLTDINSLRPSDAIWWHRFGSTLAQVMVCCLMAPSHYLNQCWLIISKVHWHSFDYNFRRDIAAINHWN